MSQIKGNNLHVNLSASQARRRLKGLGFGVRKVQSAGRNEAVIIHTATGDHLQELQRIFEGAITSTTDHKESNMNSRQLKKLGVPDDCVKSAIVGIQSATKGGNLKGKQIKEAIQSVVENPSDHTEDEHFGQFAKDVIEDRAFVRPDSIDYRTWGTDIDDAAHGQMKQACGVPMAAGAALMPDAHVGYGLPIGGVLALENAVIPYAVGVDIACRMKLSVLDIPPSTLDTKFNLYRAYA